MWENEHFHHSGCPVSRYGCIPAAPCNSAHSAETERGRGRRRGHSIAAFFATSAGVLVRLCEPWCDALPTLPGPIVVGRAWQPDGGGYGVSSVASVGDELSMPRPGRLFSFTRGVTVDYCGIRATSSLNSTIAERNITFQRSLLMILFGKDAYKSAPRLG